MRKPCSIHPGNAAQSQRNGCSISPLAAQFGRHMHARRPGTQHHSLGKTKALNSGGSGGRAPAYWVAFCSVTMALFIRARGLIEPEYTQKDTCAAHEADKHVNAQCGNVVRRTAMFKWQNVMRFVNAETLKAEHEKQNRRKSTGGR